MKVRLITLISETMKLRQDLGIEMLNQVLLDNGYDSETINFTYKYKFKYASSIEYAEYVSEIGSMPMLLKIIENYKNKRPLRENIDESNLVSFEVSYPKAVLDKMDEHINNLDISDDDVFCFCTTYISIVMMIYYALKIKTINRNVKIVFGAYHVTLSKNTRDLILRLGIADTVVINDGVSVIVDVVEGRKTGLIDGSFIKNPRLPDYNETKINACDGWITTLTSYGCPNRCTFCASGRQWLGFDLDYVENYHKSLIEKYPNIKFYYTDDNINTSIERFSAVADMIARLNRPWRAFANPIQINSEIIAKLQGIPCDYVYLGAEGFSNELLKHLGKPGLTVSIVKAGIEMLAKGEIPVCLGLILGIPGEDRRISEKTDRTCQDLISRYGSLRTGGMLDIIPTAFKIFPNSQHYLTPEKFGIQFEYWEDKYINQIPEISDIVRKVPKKFNIDGVDQKMTRERVLRMRKEYDLPME